MAKIEAVLVVGGGVAGLTAAAALHRQGFTTELVERQPTWHALGAGFLVQGNGMRMLRSLGLAAYVEKAGAVVRRWQFCDEQGNALSETDLAVLNANYLRVKLRDSFTVPFDRINMHEFVCRGAGAGTPVRALDVSKRLLDYGFHPPTNYFPLIVPEALMIEPTETESKPTLDAFVAAMRAIADEARKEPALVKGAPHDTPVRRLDEVKAAREPVLTDRARTSGK